MYYDYPAWVTENNFTRLHSQWAENLAYDTVECDEGIPQVDDEATTKPWVGNPNCVFDDNDSTFIRYFNTLLSREGVAHETFRVLPVQGQQVMHILYIRLKAAIPYISGRYLGSLRVEYTNAAGQTIVALPECLNFDGWLDIADDVLELRLIGSGVQNGEYYNDLNFDFYVLRPYLVGRSRVHGILSDGREVAFCTPRTYDSDFHSSACFSTPGGEQILMTVPPWHPYASSYRVCTRYGERALVVYK